MLFTLLSSVPLYLRYTVIICQNSEHLWFRYLHSVAIDFLSFTQVTHIWLRACVCSIHKISFLTLKFCVLCYWLFHCNFKSLESDVAIKSVQVNRMTWLVEHLAAAYILFLNYFSFNSFIHSYGCIVIILDPPSCPPPCPAEYTSSQRVTS